VRAVGNGAISKACQLLVSDGVLDSNQQVVMDKLKALHPTEDVPPALDREGLARLEFSDEPEEVRERYIALRQAIFSFPKESAPGPSGLRPEHLQAMVGETPGYRGMSYSRSWIGSSVGDYKMAFTPIWRAYYALPSSRP